MPNWVLTFYQVSTEDDSWMSCNSSYDRYHEQGGEIAVDLARRAILWGIKSGELNG
jgi:hypothetical protein